MKDFQHDNPSNWKFGMFYVNKADSRLIVPKLNPMMGWTFNFAHPISYVVMLLLLVIPILSIILLS
ncbi:MAG: DUF5808 domain-containing protein [Pedobacter sp.]|nr:DUF5808 domain-containing protein [Pedobacter sp.]MDQ8052150.1 DUF5808 domain-containing protein [Pedobacter sp.]